jgi:hypothetical protein
MVYDEWGGIFGGGHNVGTAGNIRQNEECSAAAMPAGVVVEHVLANTRTRALGGGGNYGPSLRTLFGEFMPNLAAESRFVH